MRQLILVCENFSGLCSYAGSDAVASSWSGQLGGSGVACCQWVWCCLLLPLVLTPPLRGLQAWPCLVATPTRSLVLCPLHSHRYIQASRIIVKHSIQSCLAGHPHANQQQYYVRCFVIQMLLELHTNQSHLRPQVAEAD